MSALSTAIPLKSQREIFIRAESGQAIPERRLDSPHPVAETKPKRVTETEYWEEYYEEPEIFYEWNNGILEEIGVSDRETISMYVWFFELVGYYLNTHPIGTRMFLKTGFRMALPHKIAIRRPDLGIILDKGAVPYKPTDNSYRGICNLCVEAVSDSKKKYITQDVKVKFEEYEAAGVQEYFILYSKDIHTEFYRLNEHGLYVPIKRVAGDVIQSQVLPGFQFRISDLLNQPTPKQMAFDPVYEKFVLPYYQEERKKAEAEQRLRQQETQRADEERKKAVAETQRADMAEARAKEAEDRSQHFETKAKEAEDRIKLLEAELARLRKS